MEEEHKRCAAFYLIEKYGNCACHAEIFQLWKRFCWNDKHHLYREARYAAPRAHR